MKAPLPASMMHPFVAVVVPCRNEAAYIRPLLESLLRSEHPRERLELVFVDGMSTDGTRELLEAAAKEHSFIRVLDNPRMIAPTAMNVGIRATRAEIVVRIDAHSEYPADYIPRCVQLLRSEAKIGNAGGMPVPLPNGRSPWAASVAYVTAHRFGVGNSPFRTRRSPGFVDTVPCGTFHRSMFDEVGLFDERLTRNQDNELNARIQRAGYRIAFDPAIRIHYRNQPDLNGLLRQAWFTGMWNVYTVLLHPYTWKWRRYVPMAFVAYLAVLAPAAIWGAPAAPILALPLALYVFLAAACSAGAAEAGRLRVAATFVSYHLSYGTGSFVGLANVLRGRWRADLGRPLTK